MAYATGHVRQIHMIRTGIVLDVLGAVLLGLWFGWMLEAHTSTQTEAARGRPGARGPERPVRDGAGRRDTSAGADTPRPW